MNFRRDWQGDNDYVNQIIEDSKKSAMKIKSDPRLDEERVQLKKLVIGAAVCIATFLAVLFFFTLPAKAAEVDSVHIAVHGPTYHFDRKRDWDGRSYNERNWGAGIRFVYKSGFALQLGAYENSYSGIQKDGSHKTRVSGYAVVEIRLGKMGNVSGGGFIGASNNYPYHNGGVVPVGGLWGRVDGLWLGSSVAARILPPVHPKVSGAITIEPSIKVWSN